MWRIFRELIEQSSLRWCTVLRQHRRLGGGRFCASTYILDEKNRVQNYLYVLLITINTIRGALTEPWSPTEISAPDMTEATANKLASNLPGTRIIREGAYASFLAPSTLLPLPMAASAIPTPPLQIILPRKFHLPIKQLIEMPIVAGKVDIDSTAIAAGLSSFTLQRTLKNMGTSYTKLVAETRIRLATKWIRKGKRSLPDIAQALGI